MDTRPSTLNLRLARSETYWEMCTFSDGEHSFSFITTLEAAVQQSGSDAMAVLPLFQHGEKDGEEQLTTSPNEAFEKLTAEHIHWEKGNSFLGL